MSKPKVTKKQLLAFRELGRELREAGTEVYWRNTITCVLCRAVPGPTWNKTCRKCLCWTFATKKEKSDNDGMARDICATIYNHDICADGKLRAWNKLKRRMQRAGIEVLK
jgi:hypothetical protein